jgi:serine/threonine-protein kinase
MLFQMLTGVLPFRGDSMAALMYKISNEPPADIQQLRPDIPAALAAVVSRSLEKTTDARFQTGDEFSAALRLLDVGAKPATTAMESAIIHNQPSSMMATSFDKTVVNPVTAPDPTESTIVLPKPPAQG